MSEMTDKLETLQHIIIHLIPQLAGLLPVNAIVELDLRWGTSTKTLLQPQILWHNPPLHSCRFILWSRARPLCYV